MATTVQHGRDVFIMKSISTSKSFYSKAHFELFSMEFLQTKIYTQKTFYLLIDAHRVHSMMHYGHPTISRREYKQGYKCLEEDMV